MRNYPWYRAIHDEFGKPQSKDKEPSLVVVGIHTPEIDQEKEIAKVKKKLMEAKLVFPVAIDNEITMWTRYGNSYWPSVYLIDKKGAGRWGWPGELGLMGAPGEKMMREKIEELLKE